MHANPHLVGFPVLTLKNVETRVPSALRAAMQAPAEPDTHAQVEAVDDPGFHSGAVVLQPSFQLPLEDTGEQPGEARTDLHEAVQALDGQEREDERPEARPAAECNPQLPQGCCIRFRELGIRRTRRVLTLPRAELARALHHLEPSVVVFTYFNRQKSKSPPRSAQSSCGPTVASSKYLEPKWLLVMPTKKTDATLRQISDFGCAKSFINSGVLRVHACKILHAC